MVIRPVKCTHEPIEVVMTTEQEVTDYFNQDKLFRALHDSSFVKKSHICSKLKLTSVTILYNRGKSQITLSIK